jgi:adenylyltransferase/sulfurtransferase
VDSCEESGVIGVAPAALGVIQALQALNIILRKGSSLVGRLLVFDGLDASFCELRLRKDPGCPVCGKHPTIRKLIDYEAFCASREPQTGTPLETTPLELDRMLKRGEKPLLLDVREPYEHRICRLRGSKLIPMAALRSRAEELDRERLTVVYCHHGIRSARAVRALRWMGLGRTTNLTGGIEAWRLQVDPTTPAY